MHEKSLAAIDSTWDVKMESFPIEPLLVVEVAILVLIDDCGTSCTTFLIRLKTMP